MRVAFVCSGRPDNLNHLKNNRTMVDKVLSQHGWEVINTPLANISDLNTRLQEYTLNSIDVFLFFYTGHGDVSGRQQILKLQLSNSEIGVNDVLDSIFKYINPKKQAIVLDACYSGTLKDLALDNNIEFLFSSQSKEQSYEDEALGQSIFSYYYCDAINKGITSLQKIGKYITSQTERQTPLFMRIGSDEIYIAKEKNTTCPDLIHQRKNISMTNDKLQKKEDIENLIVSNDLKMATKMMVEFVTGLSGNQKLRREALLHQSSAKALNEDMRKFGKSSDTEREARLLKNSLFEFLDIIVKKND